jgi:hypothetical protein
MRMDAAFYNVTPEAQKIGLALYQDVRIMQLWDTAASASPPGEELRRHLDQCHYCTVLLRALILMQQALLCAPGIEFFLCPGSFTLANAPDMVREAFDQHLTQCSMCRDERTQALEGQTPGQVREQAARGSTGKKLVWGAAVLVLIGIGAFAGYHYLGGRNTEVARMDVANGEKSTPTVAIDPRYRDLVQTVRLEDDRIMTSVLPADRPAVKFAIDQFSLGQMGQSLMVSSELAAKGKDPGAEMVYAMTLYRTQLMTDGYREMLKSEAMAPRDTFRCWIMFQFALMVGDKTVMAREAEHLSSDAAYKDQVKAVMKQVHDRG